jgi:hypothetical protein
VFIVHD